MEDAIGLFKMMDCCGEFKKEDISVEVWDMTGLEFEGTTQKMRVPKFVGKHKDEKGFSPAIKTYYHAGIVLYVK